MTIIDLTDQEANMLIKMLKFVFKKYQVDLSPGNRGDLLLKSYEQYEFILNYFTPKHREDKIAIHVREKETNTSLARINIDPGGFHNNADGSTIRGNRLLVFSSEERDEKNDSFTHVRAFEVPEGFNNENDLEQVFLDFLGYINVRAEDKVTFSSRPLF